MVMMILAGLPWSVGGAVLWAPSLGRTHPVLLFRTHLLYFRYLGLSS